MHTLRWNSDIQHWVVEFVTTSTQRTIGFFADGQGAADLVNSLNGGQAAAVTEQRRGKLGVMPQKSDEELLKQLQTLEANEPKTTT